MHGNSLPNPLLRLYVHKTGYVHIKNIFQMYLEETRIKVAVLTVNIEPFSIHH